MNDGRDVEYVHRGFRRLDFLVKDESEYTEESCRRCGLGSVHVGGNLYQCGTRYIWTIKEGGSCEYAWFREAEAKLES
jgi:hypothetical protein